MSTEGPQSGQFVCQYEFLCQYEFQLSLSFSRQNKELEKKIHEIRVFLFYLEHLCSNYVVLDPINI